MTMIDEQLKQAIIDSGMSHRRMSFESGVNRRVIGRFVAGGFGSDIGIRNAAQLAAFLGLELKPIDNATPKTSEGK
jgi:hypothetical protein